MMSKNYWKTIAVPTAILILVVAVILLVYSGFPENTQSQYQSVINALIGSVSSLMLAVSVFWTNNVKNERDNLKEFLKIQPVMYFNFETKDFINDNGRKEYNITALKIKNVSKNVATNVIICHDYLLGYMEELHNDTIPATYKRTRNSQILHGHLEIKLGECGPYELNEVGLPKVIDIIYNDSVGNNCAQVFSCEKYGNRYQYELANYPFERTSDKFLDYAPQIIEEHRRKKERLSVKDKNKDKKVE